MKVILLLLFILAGCQDKPDQASIEKLLKETSSCTETSDCKYLKGKCPFGCHLYVNKDHVSHVESVLEGFAESCKYECEPDPGVECIAGACVPAMKP